MAPSRKLQVMFALSYGEFGELIMKLSRAALRPLLVAHERKALLSERRGVSLRERRGTTQVMSGPGVSLWARWDATTIGIMSKLYI